MAVFPALSTAASRTELSRDLALLMLREALGIYLLNRGLVRYMSLRMGGPSYEIVGGLPYVEIIIGLALVLGMFTAAAAVVAGALAILEPLFATALMLAGGGSAFRGPAFAMQSMWGGGTMTHVLIAANLIWFLPQAKNRWALDDVIFGKREAVGLLPPRIPRPGAGDGTSPGAE